MSVSGILIHSDDKDKYFINFQMSVYFSENNIFFFFNQCVTKNSFHKVIENIYLHISMQVERVMIALSLTPRLTGQSVKNNQKYCDITFGRHDVSLLYLFPPY